MTVFFGDRWDAPIVDLATRVVTPFGEPCMFCAEPIEPGDRGVLRLCVDLVDGETVTDTRPAHMECDLRSMLGDVEHLEGRCACNDPAASSRPSKPFREQARDVVAWCEAMRGRPL
jgi:hypothetical protein